MQTQRIRILAFVWYCTVAGCTWSDPHRFIYGDCMDGLRYEEKRLGTAREVLPHGIDKTDYCWRLARAWTRALEQR
jgi:hypothetical protein